MRKLDLQTCSPSNELAERFNEFTFAGNVTLGNLTATTGTFSGAVTGATFNGVNPATTDTNLNNHVGDATIHWADTTESNWQVRNNTGWVPFILTGDVTTSGDGSTTLAASSIGNDKLANMVANSFKGNANPASDVPVDLTAGSFSVGVPVVGDVCIGFTASGQLIQFDVSPFLQGGSGGGVLTEAGDILTHDGSQEKRVPQPATVDHVLTAYPTALPADRVGWNPIARLDDTISTTENVYSAAHIDNTLLSSRTRKIPVTLDNTNLTGTPGNQNVDLGQTVLNPGTASLVLDGGDGIASGYSFTGQNLIWTRTSPLREGDKIVVYDGGAPVDSAVASITTSNPEGTFAIGDTQATRDQALIDALAHINNNDGASLRMPDTDKVFQLPPGIELTINDAFINWNHVQIQNQAATQEYILRLVGDRNEFQNFRARSTATANDGNCLNIAGSDNTFFNSICNGTHASSAAGFMFKEGGTARGNKFLSTFINDAKGGFKLDGSRWLIDGLASYNCKGTHHVNSNSDVIDGSGLINNFYIYQDDTAVAARIFAETGTNPTELNIGGINLSIMENTSGRWLSIGINHGTIVRANRMNVVQNNTSLKVEHAKQIDFDNVKCLVEGTPAVGAKEIQWRISSDGDGEDPDAITLRNCVLQGVFVMEASQMTTTPQTLVFDGGVFDNSESVTVVDSQNAFVSLRAERLVIKNSPTFQGGRVPNSYVNCNTLNELDIQDAVFDTVAGAFLFNLGNQTDMSRVRLGTINNKNNTPLFQQADDNNLAATKKPHSFCDYNSTGGAPPVPTSNFFITTGSRANPDNPNTGTAYFWNGSAWEAIT